MATFIFMSTIEKTLKKGYQKLSRAKLPNVHLDAELLLEQVMKKSRAHILAHPEKKLTNKQINKYQLLITKRERLMPIAYLTENKEFYGRNFFVDQRVLIPRPETEILVEKALKILRATKNLTYTIDIGTGSGCIITTIACELSQKSNFNFLAVDISPTALTLARRNAKKHQVNTKIKFILGDLAKPLLDGIYLKKYQNFTQPIDVLITANPPYLKTKEMCEPSIKYEPRLALLGGSDGLRYYKKLAQQLQLLQKKLPYLIIHLLLEIGENQGQAIRQIFDWSKKIETKPDLSGHDRVMIITI